MSERAHWDKYFMTIAKVVSSRGTCNRRMVGALLVRDKSILATGYNGSIRSEPHCDEDGHLMVGEHCIRTVHAESNALAQAAKNGHATTSSTCYTTTYPCWYCFKLLVNAGVCRFVYNETHDHTVELERVLHAAKRIGIGLSYQSL